jgi:homoserine O-acetyltransferase/O-succinyltransferase
VPAVTAPKNIGSPHATQLLIDRLAKDPNWNGGWYYDRGGVAATLVQMRVDTLKNYSIDAQLVDRHPKPAARKAAILDLARPWAAAFDANSLVVLRRALETYDTTGSFDRIKARVLFVLSRTDKLFAPSLAPGVMGALKTAGVDARYVEIDSEFGHLASGADGEKWAPALAAFMAELMAMEERTSTGR